LGYVGSAVLGCDMAYRKVTAIFAFFDGVFNKTIEQPPIGPIATCFVAINFVIQLEHSKP
jgi:hypothetical protein